MNRRRFILGTGIVSAGLLEAQGAVPSFLSSNPATGFKSNSKLEENPVPFTVPPLPYPNDALEPHIDAKTMEIHHDKHHGAYVNNLNTALEKAPDFANKSLDELLKNLSAVPEAIRATVRNNGGGHW